MCYLKIILPTSCENFKGNKEFGLRDLETAYGVVVIAQRGNNGSLNQGSVLGMERRDMWKQFPAIMVVHIINSLGGLQSLI